MTASWGAVILAGGAGRRLGGADKPALVVNGQTLLDRVVGACAAASEIVVVGPRRHTVAEVGWAREEPPGGGPVAALAAGLPALTTAPAIVAVLAADLPLITPSLVQRLLDGLSQDVDAVAVRDADEQVQPLVAAYRREPLTAALAALGDPRDRPFRALLPRLRLATIPDESGGSDIDTPSDLARWHGTPDHR